MVMEQVGKYGLPAALAALQFVLTGGIGKAQAQFDQDPNNNPPFWDWGLTGLGMGLGALSPNLEHLLGGYTNPALAGANFLLTEGPQKIASLVQGHPPSALDWAATGLGVAAPWAYDLIPGTWAQKLKVFPIDPDDVAPFLGPLLGQASSAQATAPDQPQDQTPDQAPPPPTRRRIRRQVT